MTNAQLAVFLHDVRRSELEENPKVYLKAVRVTLLALGYDPAWVNTEFVSILDQYFTSELKALEPNFD